MLLISERFNYSHFRERLPNAFTFITLGRKLRWVWLMAQSMEDGGSQRQGKTVVFFQYRFPVIQNTLIQKLLKFSSEVNQKLYINIQVKILKFVFSPKSYEITIFSFVK